MTKSRYTVRVAALVLVACLGQSGVGQTILYSDSFDRTTGSGDPNGKPADPDNFSSWGDNDNTFGGSLVNTWIVGPERGGGANQVTDGSVASTVDGAARYPVDITSLAPNGFTVEFDFNRFAPFNPPDPFGENVGFLSVGFGTNDEAGLGGGQFNVNHADLTILFQQAAGPNVGNTQLFQDSEFLPGTGSEGPVDYGDPLAGHSVELTLVPTAAGQYSDDDSVNGTLIVDGGTPYNFTVLGGSNFGTLSFSSNQFVHRTYDNLVVTALPVTGVPGDKDGDNDVDGADLIITQRDAPGEISIWQSGYGTGVGGVAGAAAVPEPATAGLMFVGLALWRLASTRRQT